MVLTRTLFLAAGLAVQAAGAETVTVFGAASLHGALGEIASAWQGQTGHAVQMSFAGSSALARQIQQGAPADIYIPASSDWMDALQASGDIRGETRRDILGNRLVLVAQKGTKPVPGDPLDLPKILADGFLAMALVDAVPAGIYGRQALQSLGQWDQIAAQVVQGENVSAALNFVTSGAAKMGIVYASDLSPEVQLIAVFPASSHAPITYPAALTAQSRAPAAPDFLDFLGSVTAKTIWARHGFETLP